MAGVLVRAKGKKCKAQGETIKARSLARAIYGNRCKSLNSRKSGSPTSHNKKAVI
jgi:hypothetical protein